MEDKAFLLVIIVPGLLVFLALFNFIGNGGGFGLGPATNGCIGRKMDFGDVKKYFPIGEKELKTLVYIKYFVPESSSAKTFCLGQNIR